MQTFDWSEVVEFLNGNKDTVFNYYGPSTESCVPCLLAGFFKSKGLKGVASVSGTLLVDYPNDTIGAKIENIPAGHIMRIHQGVETGQDILNYLKRV